MHCSTRLNTWGAIISYLCNGLHEASNILGLTMFADDTNLFLFLLT